MSPHSFNTVSKGHGPSPDMWTYHLCLCLEAFSCSHFVVNSAILISHRSFTSVAKPSAVARPTNVKSEACSVKRSVISSISHIIVICFHISLRSQPIVSVHSHASDHDLTSGRGDLRRSGCLEVNCKKIFIAPKYALVATRNSSDHVSLLSVTSQRRGHLTGIGLLWNPCWFLFSVQTSRRCVLSSSLSSFIFLHGFALLIVPAFLSSRFLALIQ